MQCLSSASRVRPASHHVEYPATPSMSERRVTDASGPTGGKATWKRRRRDQREGQCLTLRLPR
jgi:hypothetical protein